MTEWNKVKPGTKFIVNSESNNNSELTFRGFADQEQGILVFYSPTSPLNNLEMHVYWETLLTTNEFGKNWTAYEVIE